MGEHTEKQFVYLRQKLGRNTHPERKGMGILSNKEECSKSEARQRDFPGGAVVKTSCSQCRGPRFDPWSGN